MIRTVMAREPLPDGPSVFLAGPSAKDKALSWRLAALQHLWMTWDGPETLTVLNPESRGERADRYIDQFEWENAARAAATVVLFWIPRDLQSLPGFTTNVEFGYDLAAGRCVVLGAPPDCPNPDRNRYLIALAEDHGAPVTNTLTDTVKTALRLVQSHRDHP